MQDSQPDTPADPGFLTRYAPPPRKALPRPPVGEDCFEVLKRLAAEMEDRHPRRPGPHR